jgi:hypothetical protein
LSRRRHSANSEPAAFDIANMGATVKNAIAVCDSAKTHAAESSLQISPVRLPILFASAYERYEK